MTTGTPVRRPSHRTGPTGERFCAPPDWPERAWSAPRPWALRPCPRRPRQSGRPLRPARAEGCPTVDNPTLVQSTGITQLALPWALGGYEYGGVINQIFHGWVGDVRIVNRPLPVSDFMLYR
jgi:hypothetical protein